MKVPSMFHSRLFQAGVWLLLAFLIILVGREISFVFQPILVVFRTLFFPFLAAGFLYFLLDPLVGQLAKYRIPRWASVVLIYLAFVLGSYFFVTTLGSALYREIERLIKDVPRQLEQLQGLLLALQENPWIDQILQEQSQYMDRAAEQLTGFLERLISGIAGGVGRFFGSAAEALLVIVAIPFILFYMLKDGPRWPDLLLGLVPKKYRHDAYTVLTDIKWAISSYIQGIVLVCFSVGVLVYIGYRLIGLDYPLLLALFSMITNVIPFVGPIIGSIPALVIGLIHSPFMALKVVVVVVVVQQVESLLISPQVLGRKLATGPLTVVLLVLVAGRMAGLVGMILALPTFVIIKMTVNHLLTFLRDHR